MVQGSQASPGDAGGNHGYGVTRGRRSQHSRKGFVRLASADGA